VAGDAGNAIVDAAIPGDADDAMIDIADIDRGEAPVEPDDIKAEDS
jgi:hypothetical protein